LGDVDIYIGERLGMGGTVSCEESFIGARKEATWGGVGV
jgi:hypothetical protein